VTLHLPRAQWESLDTKPSLPMRHLADTVLLEGDNSQEMIELLLAQGLPLTDLRIETPTLETVFLNLTGRG
jgi:hypothetical protein